MCLLPRLGLFSLAAVYLRDGGEGGRRVVASVSGLTERVHAGDVDLICGFAGRAEPVARVELLGLLGEELTNRAGHGEAAVGVDVDFADAVLDAVLNLLDGNAEGVGHLAAELVDDVNEFLRDRAGTVHDHVAVRHAVVDLVDALHREDRGKHLARYGVFASGLVGAVAGADGDCERVDAGLGYELLGLGRVGEVLVDFFGAESGAVAVFDAAEAAEFGFNGHALRMREGNNRLRDGDVGFVRIRGLAVFGERAVDHDRREAERDGLLAGLDAVAVVEVHGKRDFGKFLFGGLDQVAQIDHLAVLEGAAAGLDNDRALGVMCGLHDRLDLFHIVDVERANAIAALRGFIQNLTHWDEWHIRCSFSSSKAIVCSEPQLPHRDSVRGCAIIALEEHARNDLVESVMAYGRKRAGYDILNALEGNSPICIVRGWIAVLESLDRIRVEVVAGLDAGRRSELGQFMTPASVARFMASLFPPSRLEICRLLEPGAGMGALATAFLERCIKRELRFEEVHVAAFEIDDALRIHLEDALAKFAELQDIFQTVYPDDFIEAAVDSLNGSLFGDPFPPFTHAILNPPYRKISTQSRHRLLLRQVGIETVNLYSAFVALALAMLAPGGHLVAIVPRSFCNGPYYRPFREFLFSRAAIRRMHLFAARDKAFRDDAVLQENLIIHLERGARQGDVAISTSTDDQFDDCAMHMYPFDQIVFPDDPERFIHVPTSPEGGSLDLFNSFQHALSDLDIQVSTGPIVDFRLSEYLRDMPEAGSVPLLYPCHFGATDLEWPKLNGKKPNAIINNAETERWLYPSGFYTVVRRFSSKEERRRIVASVVCPSALGASMLGFENHLNVFHRNKQGLPESLAWGLAAFLNSTTVDKAFRRFNGHTQVNATDLRMMKYPSQEELARLGRWAMKQREFSQESLDLQLEAIA